MDDENKTATSLTARTAQELSIRTSLVRRGLQDISQHLTTSVDLSPQAIRGTILDLYEDPAWGAAAYAGRVRGFDSTTFLCEIENVSNQNQSLDQKTIAVFWRPKSHGQFVPFPGANVLLPLRSLTLEPHTVATGILIEITEGLVEGQSTEGSAVEILRGSIELSACDRTSGVKILFST